MEFKVKDITIQDVKKFGLFGTSTMFIQSNKNNGKIFAFGENERMRSFILFLIDETIKERKLNKTKDCSSFKILDNILSCLFVQNDLLCGEWSAEWLSNIVSFVNDKINIAKISNESNTEEKENVKHSLKLQKGMKGKKI